ncbi:MAG: hypothetical protein F6J97_16265 [Leptolyngbya sp. SIO4C1]|nr:hypothetical protein [Leptolyngbya sp. SIO4C1]
MLCNHCLRKQTCLPALMAQRDAFIRDRMKQLKRCDRRRLSWRGRLIQWLRLTP